MAAMARSGDVQDERSGFLFPTNPKYVHPGFSILRCSNCAIHGFACTQCRGAMAEFLFQTNSKYCRPWQHRFYAPGKI